MVKCTKKQFRTKNRSAAAEAPDSAARAHPDEVAQRELYDAARGHGSEACFAEHGEPSFPTTSYCTLSYCTSSYCTFSHLILPSLTLRKICGTKFFENYAIKSMDEVYSEREEAALRIERNPAIVKSVTSPHRQVNLIQVNLIQVNLIWR
jgi:hypothetical protein